VLEVLTLDEATDRVIHGDSAQVLKELPENSVDSIVTDPPYGLSDHKHEDVIKCLSAWIAGKEFVVRKKGFMGKTWDSWVPGPEIWRECYRVLKPGGHMLVFAGCYDEETDVLTKRGWVRFPEVRNDDLFASLRPDNKVEFLPAIEIVRQNHYGPMHHYFNNRVDLLVTPNHKMYVTTIGRTRNKENWKLIPSENLYKASRITKTSSGLLEYNNEPFVLAAANRNTSHGHFEVLPEMTIPAEVWAAFLGIWIAKGYTNVNHDYIVGLCHFDEKNMDELKTLLSPYFKVNRYPNSGKLVISDPRLCTHLKPLGKSPTKHIPLYVKSWSPELLKIFLDWYSRGDGDDRGCLYTSSRMLADDLQEIAMYAGWAADVSCRGIREGRAIGGRTIKQNYPAYVVRLLKSQSRPELYSQKTKSLSRTIISTDEWAGRMVYCVELPRYHTLYVRRNGKTAWCGNTRTHDLMSIAIRLAGFELRDNIGHATDEGNAALMAWVYGSGFPKSMDISKQIDKRGGTSVSWFGPWLRQERERRKITQKELAVHFPSKTGGLTGCVANWELGLNMPTPEQFNKLCEVLGLSFGKIEEAEREVISHNDRPPGWFTSGDGHDITAPATPEAKKWEGWGTALKPAWEPIIIARKPLVGTVAENVLACGCGGLNIDGCRIGTDIVVTQAKTPSDSFGVPHGRKWNGCQKNTHTGRWPANFIIGDEATAARLDEQSGISKDRPHKRGGKSPNPMSWGDERSDTEKVFGFTDEGGASRFFYQPKASKKDRNEDLPEGQINSHPTVKPTPLMEYLVKLVTPPGGIVLDPFGGSGSTGKAAHNLGFHFILVELGGDNPEHVETAACRSHAVGVVEFKPTGEVTSEVTGEVTGEVPEKSESVVEAPPAEEIDPDSIPYACAGCNADVLPVDVVWVKDRKTHQRVPYCRICRPKKEKAVKQPEPEPASAPEAAPVSPVSLESRIEQFEQANLAPVTEVKPEAKVEPVTPVKVEKPEKRQISYSGKYQRLNAKWAVFFEFLGIDYRVPKTVDGYVPDFEVKLAGMTLNLNVSNKQPSEGKLALMAGYGKNIISLTGIQVPQDVDAGGYMVYADSDNQPCRKGYYLWAECPYCGEIVLTRHEQARLPCGCHRDGNKYEDKYGLFYSPRILAAYSTAAKAKFIEQDEMIVGFEY
jgi:DNA modification methylase